MIADIFLAHAGPDAALARTLYDALDAAAPPTVFLDAASLPHGVAWDLALQRALDAASLVVLLVTPAYDDAHYLRSEVHRALGHARAGRQRLLPVYAGGRPVTDAPYGLNIVNGVSLDALGFDATVRAIREALTAPAAVLAPPSPPPPPPRVAPPWLPTGAIDHIHDTAIHSNAALFERRETLLLRLPPALRARLTGCSIPGEQIMLDLEGLNGFDRLADGTIPLAVWLRAAVRITQPGWRADCAVFERYLAVLDASPPA